MEASGKLPSGTERERAERFYEQALLLVDCCKIPEAITLFEQAIKLNPACELYRETLAFFHTSSQFLHTDQQGSSYASVARPKPNLNHRTENLSSSKWNSRLKENPSKTAWSPTASTTYISDPSDHSTINNPWESLVNRNSKRKKAQSSPIDGISNIEIFPVNGMDYTQKPSMKQEYKCPDHDVLEGEPLKMPVTGIGSHNTLHNDGIPVEDAQANHVNSSADHFGPSKGDFLEDHYVNSDNVDATFLEEMCNARESGTDDWAKYYEMLFNGLREDVSCKQSDALHSPTNHGSSDTLDEINESDHVKCGNHKKKDNTKSERTDSKCDDVCSKCGLFKASLNPPPGLTKSRVHFVNGTCVSSPSSPTCSCSKQGKTTCSEERSTKSTLSSSQQEFYRNLQYYFGGGKVKSRKTSVEAEIEGSSTKCSDSNQKSTSFGANVSSDTATNESCKSNQNGPENRHTNSRDGVNNVRKSAKEFDGCEVKGDYACGESRQRKTSLNLDEAKTDKKYTSHEGHQSTSSQQKARARDKVRSKTKLPTKSEHVKNSKEDVSQSCNSQRSRPRVKDKARDGNSVKAEDSSRVERGTEAREKPSQRRKAAQTSHAAEFDFTAIFVSLYRSGVTVTSKCFQALKSITYYILLLLLLICGFFLYSAWCVSCWLISKVLYYTAVDRLFTATRSRLSSLFEWIKKSRQARRKTSPSGQTYDLPQNGDAAIRHMLQNKDNDPYSVLGVPSDATDDDIRKQYRKLAVLIHPDKNSHSQADEAFKILANAFDILSDSEKRQDYDRETARKRRAEEREGSFGRPGSPEQFFADLGRKMQEMQNYLHCNQCDGKHRRYSTDRFILTARFCSRCNTRHAAKEGDLWAESSFLGYKLHFYACMEGEVFDVTDWAACQGLGNYRLESNPHTVHLKLKTRQPQHGGFNSRTEEEDFENFMRAFFGAFNPSKDDRYHGSHKQPKQRKRKKRR